MARFFVDRPIFAWVVSIVILIAGLACLRLLPIAQYPPIAPPNIQVTATYPGASAKTLADTVAQPIEEQVNGVPGMIYMSSTCTNNGFYTLNVTFAIGTDVNVALMLVQTRVLLAMPQIPAAVQQQGINYRMQSPNILLTINLLSPNGRYDPIYLSNYAQINLYDPLSRLPGVATVTFLGQREYSMRAWLDPQKLASLDLTTADVVNAIREQNVQVAAGNVGQQPVPRGQQYQLVLNTLGRLTTPEQFGAIIVKIGADGRIVYLRDVSELKLGAQNYDLSCFLASRGEDGAVQHLPSVGMAIYQLPQANALDVAGQVRELMEKLKQKFPEGVEYQFAYDTTPFIRHSVEDVLNTLVIAAVLVIVVVLVFLQDWHAMLLPIIDIVVSMIGTFAVMAVMGFSLNNLSLFGLVLAVGILVDDSIVVVENIERWMGMGLAAREATIKAMEEITGPVVGITLVLTSVFVPTAFVPGLSGEFFRQFALTIAVSTLISATNALTMAPARAAAWIKPHSQEHGGADREALPWWGIAALAGYLAYRLLAPPVLAAFGHYLGETKPATLWLVRGLCFVLGAVAGWRISGVVNALLGRFFGLFNRAFDFTTRHYTAGVGKLLRASVVALGVYGGLLYLTYVGFTTAPTGFIPDQDQGYLICQVELPDSASVQRTEAVIGRLQDIALENDAVERIMGVAGFSTFYQCDSSNWGTMFIILEGFEKRKRPDQQAAFVIRQLNERYRKEVLDAKVSVFSAPPVPGLGQGSGFQLQVEDNTGLGLQALEDATSAVVGKANQQPGLRHVFSSFSNNTPALYIDIDREKARQMGVTLSDVFNTLTVNMGSVYVNEFNDFGRIWQVNIQSAGGFRRDATQLSYLKVRNSQGQTVPLASLIHVRPDSGPVFVMRYNDLNSAAIIGTPAPGYSSGQAISLMGQLCDQTLPQGMGYEWTNIAYQEVTAGNTGVLVFALAVVLIFLVLSAMYESWSLPLAIILVVPMCLLCSIAGLVWIARMPVDIFSQIGFVVLVALAAKNAILLVEFARDKRKGGATHREAILEACRVRLRPILMTSLAFILGVYPLVIATGAGWEMRRSLGTAVFSGMMGVTFFGIFLTPVFYFVITWVTDRGPVAPAAPQKVQPVKPA